MQIREIRQILPVALTIRGHGLVMESAVFVLAEHCCPDHWQCVNFQQLQSLFEGVVDVDLAATAHNRETARPDG